MTPFFITGLPRSRTAWLANFLTTDHSFCYHDLSRTTLDWNELWTNDYVGDSDSGLLACVVHVHSKYPTARWLFLKNDPDKARQSYERYFTSGNEYPGTKGGDIRAAFITAQRMYEAALPLIQNKMEVRSEDLDNVTIVKQVWQWLLPLPWNQQRYELLNTFRINIIPQKLCQR